MIKADTLVHEPASRIDALAHAMGFRYENGQYVRTVGPTTKVRKTYTRRVPSVVLPVAKKRRAKGKYYTPFTDEINASLRNLAVGATYDLTAFVRDNGVPYKKIQARIQNLQWWERTQNGRTGIRYSTTRNNWNIIVTRVS